MPSWNDLLNDFNELETDEEKANWLIERYDTALKDISEKRDGRNVIFYASSFLQKPDAPAQLLQLTHEEINGFMSVMYGMEWDDNLTLLLHTPGGITNAAETVVSYLLTKFDDIEVIVPTYAMSAGTMMALAGNRLIMGRQSQLGPIDPQMQISGRGVSARAIVEQFGTAKEEILENRETAHVWAPILQTIGPAILQEAENALAYGERMVARWLAERMFADEEDPQAKADAVASHFNDATTHKSHGRRIGRDECREQGIIVEELEDDQELQDLVLTAYHMTTLVFEKTPVVKAISGHHGRRWVKNFQQGN